jgi:hypothetical protein
MRAAFLRQGLRTGVVALALLAAWSAGAADFRSPRNDPNFRENAEPAYFPNQAIPPKYPEPKPQTHGLDLTKRDWATSTAYFKWLCENEAGEFIYRTVDNVDAVFEMRRRPEFDRDWRLLDRYYLEDPSGWPITASGREEIFDPYMYVMPSTICGVSYKDPAQWCQRGDYIRYQPEFRGPVFERVTSTLEKQRYGDARFMRFTRVWPTHPEYDRDAKGRVRMFQLRKHLNVPPLSQLPHFGSFEAQNVYRSPDRKLYDNVRRSQGHIIPDVQPTNEIKSHYGFMWRGIERSPHDRELGIGGGEVLVFDLQTNEVLAVRRNFRLSGTIAGTRNVDWLNAKECLSFDFEDLHPKVLKPIDPYKDRDLLPQGPVPPAQ